MPFPSFIAIMNYWYFINVRAIIMHRVLYYSFLCGCAHWFVSDLLWLLKFYNNNHTLFLTMQCNLPYTQFKIQTQNTSLSLLKSIKLLYILLNSNQTSRFLYLSKTYLDVTLRLCYSYYPQIQNLLLKSLSPCLTPTFTNNSTVSKPEQAISASLITEYMCF